VGEYFRDLKHRLCCRNPASPRKAYSKNANPINVPFGTQEGADLDALDEKLIEILKEDARTRNVVIAQRLGLSEGTIRTRIKRLVNRGIIRSFTIKTVGKNVKAMVDVGIRVNVNTTAIAGAIMELPGVEEVYEVSGDVDICVIVDVMSTVELNEIIEKIRTFPDVSFTRTRVILNEL